MSAHRRECRMPREDRLEKPTKAHLEWLEIQMTMARAKYGPSVDTPAFRKSLLADLLEESERQILDQIKDYRKEHPKPRQTKGRKSASIWPIKT